MIRNKYKEVGCAYITWAVIALVFFGSILIMFGCKTTQVGSQAFDVLGKLTEAKLKELLMYEGSMRKDSFVVSVIVPRKHCRKVLGKKLNSFVTAKGEATLNKANLQISLQWTVLQDTSRVQLRFIKQKYD